MGWLCFGLIFLIGFSIVFSPWLSDTSSQDYSFNDEEWKEWNNL